MNVLSFGGGVNSVAVLLLALENNDFPDLVVFADTGDEEPHTLAVVAHAEILCRQNGVDFVTVRRDGPGIVEWHEENRVVPLPHRGFRACTGKFKVAPIRQELRRRGATSAVMRIGFATDEAHRVKPSDVQWITHTYPLLDAGMSRADCEAIIAAHWDGPPVKKSGCAGCPFIGPRGFLRLARTDRPTFQKWRRLEEACRDYPAGRLFVDGPTLAEIEARADTETSLDAFGVEGMGLCADEGGCWT